MHSKIFYPKEIIEMDHPKLYKKYGWKEQLREDINSVRAEVLRKGGIEAEVIDNAIKRYRATIGESGA
ncbi:MAG: hypothetical protein AB1414_08775 [bacterium]